MTINPFEMCSITALKPFVKCLESRGINANLFLERQKIPQQMMVLGEGYIAKRQAWNFFEDVKRREGLVEFGFLDGDSYSLDDLGAIGDALQQAVTLKDAIDTFSQLVYVFAEGNSIQLMQGAKKSWLLCYTPKQDRSIHVADQHTILILRQIIRSAAGSQWQPDEVMCLSSPMKQHKDWTALPDAKLQFFQPYAGVAFQTDLLSKPLINFQVSNNFSQKRSAIPSPPPTCSSALASLFEFWITTSRLPTIIEVSEILGTSRMTLFRALSQEKTSYRKIVERVKFMAAQELLKNPSLTLQEISHQLFYSAPSNFSRSFLRMSGITPAKFREKVNSD